MKWFVVKGKFGVLTGALLVGCGLVGAVLLTSTDQERTGQSAPPIAQPLERVTKFSSVAKIHDSALIDRSSAASPPRVAGNGSVAVDAAIESRANELVLAAGRWYASYERSQRGREAETESYSPPPIPAELREKLVRLSPQILAVVELATLIPPRPVSIAGNAHQAAPPLH